MTMRMIRTSLSATTKNAFYSLICSERLISETSPVTRIHILVLSLFSNIDVKNKTRASSCYTFSHAVPKRMAVDARAVLENSNKTLGSVNGPVKCDKTCDKQFTDTNI